MPAKSQAQQKAAAMALAAKRGEIPVSKLKGAALKMYESMTESQLRDFAKTKRKNLPKKKENKKKKKTKKSKGRTRIIG
jgi:hypothetical protein